MNKTIYNEPFFKVVNCSKEDVLTSSYGAERFAEINGFVNPTNINAPSSEGGEWNMPGVEI